MTTKVPPQLLTGGPVFRAYASATTSIPNGSNGAQVALQTETFDTDSSFNTSNGRFTPTVAGYYSITAVVSFADANMTSTTVAVAICKNASDFSSPHSSEACEVTSGSVRIGVSDIVHLNGTTDYVTMAAYQSQGSARNIQTGSAQTFMCGHLVRAVQ